MARLLKFNRSLLALSLMTAFGLAATVLSPKAAQAGAYTYGTGAQRTVNAGVLLLSGNAYPTTAAGADNKDPYVFYILNQRIDIRPVGWNIINPNAPRTVTSDVLLRWNARTGATPYQLGQTVTPGMAPYWEVPLESTPEANLAQYDVLFLCIQQGVSFTATDSEKLRQFVDGGGTLWIEDDGTGTDTVSNLFVNLTFNSGGSPGNASVPSVNRSPLIMAPYALSAQELNSLGDKNVATFYASNGSAAVPQDSAGHLILGTVIGNSANGGLPAVASGALGAGQVVVSTVGSADNINGYVSGSPASPVDTNAPNSGPYCGTNVQNAPTADLKLLTNIIASSSTHQSEHQNSRQTGVDPGSLPSAVRTWSAAIAGSSTGGVATYGHYAYVVDDSGVLRCYDIYPGEDLDGDGNSDDGIQDYSKGYPFDEVWTSSGLGTYASAPTVAVDNSTTPPTAYVLVEEDDGKVMEFPAIPTTSGVLTTTSTGTALKGSGSATTSYSATTGPAPAPTYYNGKVYAGDGDSNLYISTLSPSNAGTKLSVDSSPMAGETPVESIVAPPSVGIVPDGSGGSDIVALCTTNRGLYSVFLGSRGELLSPIANMGTYNSKLALMNPIAQMDTTAASAGGVLRAYTLDTLGDPVLQSANPSATTPNFTLGTVPMTLFADYNANISSTVSTAGAATPGPLTRTSVGGTSSNNPNIMMFGAYVSAPALDRLGNIYYTVTDPMSNDSVLFSVHDGPKGSQVSINWRFRLPATTDGAVVDADNTPYANLAGFQFVTKIPPGGATVGSQVTLPSAPVVDAQGNVYVLATNVNGGQEPTGTGAVLCFNSQGVVSADVLASGDASGLSSVSISQPINGALDEFGANSPESLVGTQYTVSGGSIDFTNFGTESPGGGGTAMTHELNPNLNEPYPVTISYSTGTGANATPQTAAVRPLHTNLAWYTVLTSTTAVAPITTTTILPTSGLTEVGSKLYFMDSSGLLDTVIADPQAEGVALVNKVISPTAASTSGTPMFTQGTTSSGVGVTAAVPSSAGGAMLVTGPNGTAAYTNQITLVVDANRVMEIDASGNAQWAVDSTSKTSVAGSAQPLTPGQTTAGRVVTTTLELNKPSSVYELAQNDYLVADTGNNRCVRFDRAGKVLWELSQFTDPNSLMTAGESATLNQPTSVQVTSSIDAGGNTTLHYLVSDTGNDRIVEIDDVYNAQYQVVANKYHILAWISHTQDVQGRDYRYQSAAYYYNGNTKKTYVVALVTNKRVASLTPAGALSPANQDTQGGSIVLLGYIPGAPSTSTTNGYISALINSFTANIDATGEAFPQDGTVVSLYLRNPRYLKAFLPQGASATAAQSFLLADDNGAWAITPNAAGTAYSAAFGFTQADYQAMTVPLSASTTTTTSSRANLPFIPASLQLLGTDVSGGNTYGRFLITNSFSQGEAANDPTKIGGEVFEIDQLVTSQTGTTQIDSVGAQTGGYAGHTLNRPSNTSPISQPTFGFRLQF